MLPTYQLQQLIKKATENRENYAVNDPTRYMELVSQCAFRYASKYPRIPFEDIFGYGMIGLTNACKRFDGDEFARLAYYKTYIEGEIRHGITTELNYVHQAVNNMQKEETTIISMTGGGIDKEYERDDRMITVERYLSGSNSLKIEEIAILKRELKFTDTLKSDICREFRLDSKGYQVCLDNAIKTMRKELVYA